MEKFTVLGSGGFIGSQLARVLEQEHGGAVNIPARHALASASAELFQYDLGHVFYCIGLTSDFRSHPWETVEAHVCLLRQLLQGGRFETLTYLSSTRVYEGATHTEETTPLKVLASNPGHIYNLSKLMGEALCHAKGKSAKVVRLSNVFGRGMSKQSFLSQVLQEASVSGKVHFLTAPVSAKDYVSIHDVLHWLPRIALDGQQPVYNVASGQNTSNAEIATALEKLGVTVSYADHATEWSFPAIDTRRLNEEFGPPTCAVLDELDHLLAIQ